MMSSFTLSTFLVNVHLLIQGQFTLIKVNRPDQICSLVDGGALRTFLGDPMHTLRSSGYTLSGIYIYTILHTNP